MNNLFDTRSHAWKEAGLAREVAARTAKRARAETLVLLAVLAAVFVVFSERRAIFGGGYDTPVRIGTIIALVIIGWWVARDVGRAAGPWLMRRMDPATAGTFGFLIRLVTILVVIVVALRIAKLPAGTIVVGGGFTAVIFGLAAQQTLGNLIAGLVLLSARPFRVGERVRLQGGGIGGRVEGVVSSLGLLYTSFNEGEDRVMVPNSVVLNVAVTPLREPESVSLRARLRSDITPAEVEQRIADALSVAVRAKPSVTLEELDGEEVVVLIEATPVHASEGSQLASEMLEVVARETTS
jgi:small-conductance mechanosensitive channel